jgi:hypothetical protein
MYLILQKNGDHEVSQMGWGCISVVECLPSKHKVELIFNRRKKERKRKRERERERKRERKEGGQAGTCL